MASESIISATFGSPGSGKTYSRVRWLVEDFLINNPTGLYITNIPLNIPVISEYMSRVLSKNDVTVSPSDITARLHIIPDDVLVYWEKLNQVDNKDLQTFTSDTFPPSQYLQQFNLEGAHIAIDEFHKYFSKRGPKALKKLWNDWFAEIRKTGCVFEAITQSYGQMSDEFLDKCASRLELINHSDLRDPIFKIRMGDWYELRAGVLGKIPLQRVSEVETMRSSSDSGRVSWQRTGKVDSFTLDPFYFQFYNSFHNSTGSSGVRKSAAEIYGKRVVFWFLRRNIFNILPRFLLAALICWFLLGGGFTMSLKYLFSSFLFVSQQNKINVSEKSPVSEKSSVSEKPPVSENKNSLKEVNPFMSKYAGLSDDEIRRVKLEEREYLLALDNFKPAIFFNDYCILRNSLEISVGYKFNGGIYDGKTVVEINPKKRYYVLDNGSFVTMF